MPAIDLLLAKPRLDTGIEPEAGPVLVASVMCVSLGGLPVPILYSMRRLAGMRVVGAGTEGQGGGGSDLTDLLGGRDFGTEGALLAVAALAGGALLAVGALEAEGALLPDGALDAVGALELDGALLPDAALLPDGAVLGATLLLGATLGGGAALPEAERALEPGAEGEALTAALGAGPDAGAETCLTPRRRVYRK